MSRTDLALEQAGTLCDMEGIAMLERGKAFRITEITIDSDEHGAIIGRGKGRYLTLEAEQLSHFSADYREQTEELAAELRSFLPSGEILAVGLGNSDITPDALGPATAAKILATRHLRTELAADNADTRFLRNLRPVSVLANGVLGQTGIETAELVTALRDTVHPQAIIAIDALACSDLHRLGTTIQISDAGISPGSGVQNSRKELSVRTLGIPVIAVGVPMVVDMHTIAAHYAGQTIAEQHDTLPNMMVTPRDIDKLLSRASDLLAAALNLALHPQLTFADIEALA